MSIFAKVKEWVAANNKCAQVALAAFIVGSIIGWAVG